MKPPIPWLVLPLLLACDAPGVSGPAPVDKVATCSDLPQQGEQVTPVIEASKDHAPETGGTIANGIYVLTSNVVSEGSPATAPFAATLQVSGATMTEVTTFSAGDVRRTVSAFSISGNTLTRNSICTYVADGGTPLGSDAVGFTSTATQLTFSAAAGATTPYFAEVYTKL